MLTYHDVNLVYNLHHLKGKGYYLKTRQPEIRLIQCLPNSNKGLNKDFLIVSGRWHDGLLYPTQEGQPGVVIEVGKIIYFLHYSDLCYLTLNDLYLMPIADRCTTEPNFNLVNIEGLDKILKAEAFVNEDNGQLRAVHLILGITPISRAFQVPKCVIKVHDPHLCRISIAVEGFLFPEGAPIPEGTFSTRPILFLGPTTEGTQSSTPISEGIPKVEVSSSQQFTEIDTSSHTRDSKEEEMVEVTDSEDKLKVFNKDLSPETSVTNLSPHFSPIIDEMGLQRKPKSSLLELIEN